MEEFINSVQSIARNGTVPRQYIQPTETRPINKTATSSSVTESIPLINLGGCGGGGDVDGDVGSLQEEIRWACREWGAFHVVNHGIRVELLDEIKKVGKIFFEDTDVKMKKEYSCDPNAPATEGYGSRMLVSSNDTVLDWRDYFDHHTLPLSRRNPTRWPHFPGNYREVMAEYSDCMNILAQKLLGLISESLCLPSSCIKDHVGKIYQNITVSYYPPCPQPDLTLGLQSHSDMGALTLLIQDDVGGLQVFKNGEWITVPPLRDGILVLLADQTEIITNGKYRSCQHRAITNSQRARLSVATFHDPAKTRKIFPALEIPKYREVIYGDYLKSWYTKGPEGKRNLDALLL